jgi:hypothetical protein
MSHNFINVMIYNTSSNEAHYSIDGFLRSFMANCVLTNALTDIHSEQVPNTHVRGSKQIDFALLTD